MKALLISEVIDLANKSATPEEAVKVLQQHNSLGLRDILRAALDDTIIFNLPAGAPKFESPVNHTDGEVPTNLIRRTPELTYMVKGGPGDKLHPARREGLFLAMLEGIDPKDSELLILVKDKKFNEKWPKITKAVVSKAFPKLIRK